MQHPFPTILKRVNQFTEFQKFPAVLSQRQRDKLYTAEPDCISHLQLIFLPSSLPRCLAGKKLLVLLSPGSTHSSIWFKWCHQKRLPLSTDFVHYSEHPLLSHMVINVFGRWNFYSHCLVLFSSFQSSVSPLLQFAQFSFWSFNLKPPQKCLYFCSNETWASRL